LTSLSAVKLCPSILNRVGYSLIERSEDTTSVDPQIAAHLTYPNNAVAPSAENYKSFKILFI